METKLYRGTVKSVKRGKVFFFKNCGAASLGSST